MLQVAAGNNRYAIVGRIGDHRGVLSIVQVHINTVHINVAPVHGAARRLGVLRWRHAGNFRQAIRDEEQRLSSIVWRSRKKTRRIVYRLSKVSADRKSAVEGKRVENGDDSRATSE